MFSPLQVLFQMLSSGAQYLIHGERNDLTLNRIHKKPFSQMAAEFADPARTDPSGRQVLEKLEQNIIDCLTELKYFDEKGLLDLQGDLAGVPLRLEFDGPTGEADMMVLPCRDRSFLPGQAVVDELIYGLEVSPVEKDRQEMKGKAVGMKGGMKGKTNKAKGGSFWGGEWSSSGGRSWRGEGSAQAPRAKGWFERYGGNGGGKEGEGKGFGGKKAGKKGSNSGKFFSKVRMPSPTVGGEQGQARAEPSQAEQAVVGETEAEVMVVQLQRQEPRSCAEEPRTDVAISPDDAEQELPTSVEKEIIYEQKEQAASNVEKEQAPNVEKQQAGPNIEKEQVSNAEKEQAPNVEKEQVVPNVEKEQAPSAETEQAPIPIAETVSVFETQEKSANVAKLAEKPMLSNKDFAAMVSGSTMATTLLEGA